MSVRRRTCLIGVGPRGRARLRSAATIGDLGQDTPVLGLDLQGGISVVLAPVGKFKPSSLDVAVDIIRNRVDSLGVAEPEISRQGDNIVVDLPGVKDREKARRLVGRTAELRFARCSPSCRRRSDADDDHDDRRRARRPRPRRGAPGRPRPRPTTTPRPTCRKPAKAPAVASCESNQVVTLLTAGRVPTTTRRPRQSAPPASLLPFWLSGQGRRCGSYSVRHAFGTGVRRRQRRRQFDSTATATRSPSAFNEGPARPLSWPPCRSPKTLRRRTRSRSSSTARWYWNPAFESSIIGTVQITGNFSPSEASDLATVINYGALPVQLKELTSRACRRPRHQDQLNAGVAGRPDRPVTSSRST